MTLASGARLGPYEILSLVGAGGMGEVYKAKDTRLDRIVAIKILSPALAADPQFRERFDREARTISQLDHPHICAFYDVGEQHGTAYLVMQYLEGETLADRLRRDVPLDQALTMAIEIASALDKAHRAGIVHRDLKPGNIMLTKAGAKLLDFGLAKASGPAITGASQSMLPTTPPNITAQGTILGTFQYMAPEQLEGAEADARTDIFAFGAVVYEMVTGKKAFEGKSRASVISAIMSSEPAPIAVSQPSAPSALDHLVKTCLAKDGDDRWQSVGDVMRVLQWIASGSALGEPAAMPVTRAHHRRERWAWALVVIVSFVAAGLTLLLVGARQSSAPVVTRFSVQPPEDGAFSRRTSGGMLAVSPDGRTLAFVAAGSGGTNMLWLRSLDALTARAVPGTEGSDAPFWSTDSQSIGFFANDRLKTVRIDGGEPRTICEATGSHQATWSQAGVILFVASARGVGGLARVSSAGGTVASETTPDQSGGETGYLLPYFLPDGQHFLYDVTAADGVSVNMGSLGSKERRRLLNPSEMTGASSLAYARTGHLLFVRDRTLVALRFDASRLERTGEPQPVVEGVQSIGFAGGAAAFSVSANGVLAYWRGAEPATARLTWFTRDGRETAAPIPVSSYGRLALAPDGNHVAIEGQNEPGSPGIWLLDLVRGTTTRFTNDAFSIWPIWSPDGTSLIFSSTRADGRLAPYRQSVTTGGEAWRLFDPSTPTVATDWSADGQTVVIQTGAPPRGDIGVFALTGASAPRPFLRATAGQTDGHLSPDGRWMAYVSNESGGQEVYVTGFPGGGGKWPISTHGGSQPRWRADGKELYYRASSGKLMAVTIKTEPTLEASVPVTLFDTSANFYAVTNDGRRFLLVLPQSEPTSPPITVVLNWHATLAAREDR